jgi:hypothetical protein
MNKVIDAKVVDIHGIHALNVRPATGKFFSNCGMVNQFMRVCQQRRKESRNSSLNMVQAN